MNFKNLLYSKDSGIAIITINRPEVRNAANQETMKELVDAFALSDADDEVRVIIISGGNEKYFSSGAEVGTMEKSDVISMYDRVQRSKRTLLAVENCTKPVIAAASGYAFGFGFELLMCCDFLIIGDNAKFGLPEIGIGIMPGTGGTQRLTNLIGTSRAKQVIMLGDRIDAEMALRWGLAYKVVPARETLVAAREIANTFVSKPGIALRFAKECINWAAVNGSSTGLEYECAKFSMLYATDDQKEGMLAFREKRQPAFSNQ